MIGAGAGEVTTGAVIDTVVIGVGAALLLVRFFLKAPEGDDVSVYSLQVSLPTYQPHDKRLA